MGHSTSKPALQQEEKRRRVGPHGGEGEPSVAPRIPVHPLGEEVAAENEERLNELQQIRFGFRNSKSGRPVEMKASSLEAAARRLGDAKIAREMMLHRRSHGLKSGAIRSSGRESSGPASDMDTSTEAAAKTTETKEKSLAVHKAAGKPSITSEICRSLEQAKVGSAGPAGRPPSPQPSSQQLGNKEPGNKPITAHTAKDLKGSYGGEPEDTSCLDDAAVGLTLLGSASAEGGAQQPQDALPYASWTLVEISTPSGPVCCFVEPGKEHLIGEQMVMTRAATGKRIREGLE